MIQNQDIRRLGKVVDNTVHARAYQISKDDLHTSMTDFTAIENFLDISLGMVYTNTIGVEYLKRYLGRLNHYKDHHDKEIVSPTEGDELRSKFDNTILALSLACKEAVRKYTAIEKQDRNREEIGVTEHNYYISNELVPRKNLETLTADYVVAPENIKITDIPTNREYLEQIKAKDYLYSDINKILVLMAQLSRLSLFRSIDTDPFRKFAQDLIFNFYGNMTECYNRDIVNRSAFAFCNKDYPKKTKSGKLYSVRNVKSTNKIKANATINKNIDAFVTFLSELEFTVPDYETEEREEAVIVETQLLKEAYSAVVALYGLYCELVLGDELLKSAFDLDKALMDNPIKGNKFNDGRIKRDFGV